MEFYPSHRTLSGRYAVPRSGLASSVMEHKKESKRVKAAMQSLDDDISSMLQIKAFEYYSYVLIPAQSLVTTLEVLNHSLQKLIR